MRTAEHVGRVMRRPAPHPRARRLPERISPERRVAPRSRQLPSQPRVAGAMTLHKPGATGHRWPLNRGGDLRRRRVSLVRANRRPLLVTTFGASLVDDELVAWGRWPPS